MKTIKISEDVWDEVAKRGKFGETEDDVLKRVFKLNEPVLHSTKIKNTYSLKELTQKDLTKSKPHELIIGNENFVVNDWSDLCVKFIKYLVDKQIITKSIIPVYSFSKKDKYFITNNLPKHSKQKGVDQWKKVTDFYVDVKYEANGHIKNLISVLKDLNYPENNVFIKIDIKRNIKRNKK